MCLLTPTQNNIARVARLTNIWLGLCLSQTAHYTQLSRYCSSVCAYLRWNNEWGPGHDDEESRGEVVDDEVLVVVARDVHVEAGEREVAQLAIVVQEHAGQHGLVLVEAAGNG